MPNSDPYKESSRPLAIVITPTAYPGMGGKQTSIRNITESLAPDGGVDVEVVCFAQKKGEEAQRHSVYGSVSVFRARNPFFSKGIHELVLRNFDSLVSGIKKLDMKGRVSMVVVGLGYSIPLMVKVTSRIWHNRNRHLIFHCHSIAAVGVAVVCRYLFWWRGVKLIFTNGFVYRRSGFRMADAWMRFILSRVDLSLCISKRSAEVLRQEFRLDPKKVRSYSFWIDAAAIMGELDSKTVFKEGLTRLLFVGRTVPEKGIQELMELAQEIERRGLSDHYHLTVIGSSVHEITDRLKEFAERSPVLTYDGMVMKPLLWRRYQEHDIVLVPSRWEEGSGNVIIEAYACGIPVVGSDRGGIPENIELFPYGRVVSKLDPDTLLEAIDSLMQDIRRVGRDAVAEASRKILKERYSERNRSAHAEAYQELLTTTR